MALLDQAVLSNDPTFVQRVRTAIIAAAVAISNEGAVTNHAQRDVIAVNVLTNPDAWKTTFAACVATDANCIADATQNGTVTLTSGNVSTQSALVTDLHINNAVSSMWNSFFAH